MGSGLLGALVSLSGPVLARVFMALGFSVVTFTGMALVFSSAKGLVMTQLGGVPLAALQLAGLAGVWQGLGMLWGAVSWVLAWWGLTKAVRITRGV